jgi:hypothetical protein
MSVVIIGAILCIITASMLLVSSNTLKNAYGRVDWNKAFFNAENAVVWAAQQTFDAGQTAGTTKTYSTAAGTLPVTALISSNGSDPSFLGAWVTVTQPAASQNNVFVITASARVNDKVRTITTQIMTRPASLVFDYEYFLNNWGWWWGSTITGNGAQRANWDFDFRGGPTVNGAIYAADQVQDNEIPIQQIATPPFGGLAGNDMTNLVHQGAQRITMPNLLDFSNYTATAMANTSSNGIWLGSTQFVFGVQSNSTKPGIYLVGTASKPVTIKGTVVIPGDVVIQGIVTGQGTMYVGGNLYVANNTTYANGPNFSTPPETQTPTNRDAWVTQNNAKDLVAYAVRGSIFAGDVTSSDWVTYCYNYPGSGLAVVGDESHLGQDGIAGTGDDNIPFLHANGTMSTWFDDDGNGVVNGNYNYSTDINMDSTRATKILGYPKDASGNPVAYNTVASNAMGTLEGIFYTDHAAAMRLTQNTATFHGVVVSRNEQIIFQSVLNFVYDSRVHSRYNNNPNQFINLGLPWGKPLQVNSFAELAPNSTGL